MNDVNPNPSHTDSFEKVNELVSKGLVTEALCLARSASEAFPDHVPLVLLLVSLLRRLGRGEEALGILRAKSEEMQRHSLLRPCVELLIEAGRPEEAKLLHSQVDHDWTNTQPYQLASLALKALEGADEAIDLADSFCRAHPDRLALWMENLRLREAHHRPQDVVAWLDDEAPHIQTVSTRLTRARFAHSKGNWDEAIPLLRSVLEQDASNPSALQLMTVTLKDCGEFTEALRVSRDGLCVMPGSLLLNTQYVDLLLKTGDKETAVEAAYRFARSAPSNPESQLAVARVFFRLGFADHGIDHLDQAETLGCDPSLLAAYRADYLMTQKDVFGANDLLSRAEIADPGRKELVFRLARTYVLLGQLCSARQTLQRIAEGEAGEETTGLLAEIAFLMGDHETAFDLSELDQDLPIQVQQSRRAQRVEIFIDRMDVLEALKLLDEGLEEDNNWADGHALRARALGLLGRIEDAWESQKRYSHLASVQAPVKAINKKPIQSIMGQLINEFRLTMGSATRDIYRQETDADVTAARFRDSIRDNHGDTSAAIGALGALRRSGQIRQRAAPPALIKGVLCIPRKIFQFWDTTEPPQQVGWLMDMNRSRNPEFEYTRFDKRTALEYLKDKGEERARRSFALAPNPAGASDILRLAILWHEGGVYIDSDDLCLRPLSDSLRLDLRFIGYQEYLMSIGNNFMAVQPRDPMIRAALDEATSSFTSTTGESPWLSSGPGVISRAVARYFIEDDGSLTQGVLLLPASDLRTFLATHIPLTYKTSERHWASTFLHKA